MRTTHWGPVSRAAERYVELITETGGRAEVTRPQGSIIAIYDLQGKALYPLGMTRYGSSKAQVALQLGYLKYRQPFHEDAAREDIYDRVTQLVGPLSTRSLAGAPAFPLERLNDPSVYEGLAKLLRDIIEKVQAEA